jgi:non-heme chloroperoxidase
MRSRITVSPGVELDVVLSGDPAGVPLLLLHGISDSNASMAVLTDQLPASVRAIAVSQRGHGDSSKPAGPYATDAFVNDAIAVLDRLGVRRAVVFGHSMGSVIAQRLAARHPGRVAGLILEGAFPGLKGNPIVEGFYAEAIAPLTDPIDPGFAREFQLSTIARPVPPAFVDLITAESCRLPARAWKQILRDMMTFDTSADLSRIKAPTILLWGDRDGFASRADQDRLVAGIAGSALTVFVGTGHDPHWEEPKRVADMIGVFIARHVAPVAA